MRLPRSILRSHLPGKSGENNVSDRNARQGSCCLLGNLYGGKFVETRVLTINADPVFQDRALSILDGFDNVETNIVRNLSEAVQALLEENFDGLIIEGDAPLALEQATHLRQHFPSLRVGCLFQSSRGSDFGAQAREQDIEILPTSWAPWRLRATLSSFVQSLDSHAGTASSEGIDPCHSLIGNLNQFSAAEILQMSCLSQRSGRFTFKSGRGNSEIYLQQGSVRHAVFGSLEGEAAVAEIFRWRQGRFYFEEGIISQEQTVSRPWAHLLIDNLQKLDETLELVSIQ